MDTLIIGIVFLAIFAIIIVIAIINSVINSKVKKYSIYYRTLKSINQKYNFNDIKHSRDEDKISFNSKRQYDSCRCDSQKIKYHFQRYITDRINYYNRLVSMIQENKVKLASYETEIKAIPLTNDKTIAKLCGISIDGLQRREKNLGEKITLTCVTNYTLALTFYYTSPAGRNHYEFTSTRNYQDIKDYLSRNETKSNTYTIHITLNENKPKTTPEPNKPKTSPEPKKPYIEKKSNFLDQIEDLDN